ncbi:hypothetical protein [Rhodosalinus sp.]|uniref:DUF7742 family protein n=1 Tax=Rhodosalinus sp. TaxID=2047741 RepID=UPI003978600B
MRPAHWPDVSAAARALLIVPPDARPGRARAMLEAAHAAHRAMKRLGRVHPRLGNGGLMVLARMAPLPPEPPLSDPEFADCLLRVLQALRDWRADPARRARRRGQGQPAAQPTQRAAVGSSASRFGAISSQEP